MKSLDYGKKYQDSVNSSIGNENVWVRSARLWQFRDLEPGDHSKRIIDYGCGYGYRIAGLPNAEGYDVSDEAVKQSRQRGIRASTELPKPGWDICVIAHVLEHTPEPLPVLKTIFRNLRPGGKAIVILPIDFYLSVDPEDKHQHLYCWNLQSIKNLMEVAGFVNVKAEKVVIPAGRRLLGFLPDSLLFPIATSIGRILRTYEIRAIGYSQIK
ncbi:MAG: class I SAM-dependent methyltransferase [Candidatus Micrarchaeota archaeon]